MPQPALIIETCAECEQDLEHCHGTGIAHSDGSAECSADPDCRLAADLHFFVVSCAEVDCACVPGLAAALTGQHAAAS